MLATGVSIDMRADVLIGVVVDAVIGAASDIGVDVLAGGDIATWAVTMTVLK